MAAKLGLGLILALALSAGAYAAGMLTLDGALAAVFVGALVYSLGGLTPAMLLVTFFLTSSLLTRWKAARKKAVQRRFEKGGRRDRGQVLANGGWTALFSLGLWLSGEACWLAGITGALAAATADTWATELGVLAKKPPRLVTSGRIVPPGTSGGVTMLGILASAAGGLSIGLPAAALSGNGRLLIAGLGAGIGGSLVDSLLGATLQAVYACPVCGVETEQHPQHVCGGPTRLVRGSRWVSNDAVNALAGLLGGLLGIAVEHIL